MAPAAATAACVALCSASKQLAPIPCLIHHSDNAAPLQDSTTNQHQAAASRMQSHQWQGRPSTLQGHFRTVKPRITPHQKQLQGLSKHPLQQVELQEPQELQPPQHPHHPLQQSTPVIPPAAVSGDPSGTDGLPALHRFPAESLEGFRCEAAVDARSLPPTVPKEIPSKQVQDLPVVVQQGLLDAIRPYFLEGVPRIQDEGEVTQFLSSVDDTERYVGRAKVRI